MTAKQIVEFFLDREHTPEKDPWRAGGLKKMSFRSKDFTGKRPESPAQPDAGETSSGVDYKERLRKLRQRRGEDPETGNRFKWEPPVE